MYDEEECFHHCAGKVFLDDLAEGFVSLTESLDAREIEAFNDGPYVILLETYTRARWASERFMRISKKGS